jgi:metal-responsive CopG/Arc/MetJ family transcriptional regulator
MEVSMPSTRTSFTTTISLPPKLYKAVMITAKANGMTNSELFREAFRRYLRDEREWQELLTYGRAKARKARTQNEVAVERLIDQSRK